MLTSPGRVENDFFGFMSTPSNQQTPRVKCGGRKEIEECMYYDVKLMKPHVVTKTSMIWNANLARKS